MRVFVREIVSMTFAISISNVHVWYVHTHNILSLGWLIVLKKNLIELIRNDNRLRVPTMYTSHIPTILLRLIKHNGTLSISFYRCAAALFLSLDCLLRMLVMMVVVGVAIDRCKIIRL